VIRADHPDAALLDALPQGFHVRLAAQGRAADEVGPIRPVILGHVHGQVVDAGLRVNVDPLVLGLAKDIQALLAGKVEDVQVAAGDLGQVDGPVYRLGFHQVVFAQGEVVGAGLTRRLEGVGEIVAHGVVFRMDPHNASVLGGEPQGLVQGCVVGHTALAGIGHVQLGGGDAPLDQAGQLPDGLPIRTGQAGVEGVIRDGLAFKLGFAQGAGIGQGLGLVPLDGKIAYRGHAPKGGGAGGGGKIVPGKAALKGVVDMHMGVDEPR